MLLLGNRTGVDVCEGQHPEIADSMRLHSSFNFSSNNIIEVHFADQRMGINSNAP